jgi:Undecaprenyl-phosphate galactose phosphotransferase WbaP
MVAVLGSAPRGRLLSLADLPLSCDFLISGVRPGCELDRLDRACVNAWLSRQPLPGCDATSGDVQSGFFGALVRSEQEPRLELPHQQFHKRSAAILKRVLDLATSTFLLLLLSPVFATIAIVIKLTSRGPILFGHSRFGRESQPFEALKFRTMVADADKILASHLELHPEEWLEWQRDQKLRKDPRITKVGKWLRRYSLDELPQLLNVFAGEMSLVGPRPIMESEILKYGRSYDLYIRVHPGITGLWQVSGRNNTTYEQRISFDEYYVRNWSIWLDLYILIRTVKVVLTAKGAY